MARERSKLAQEVHPLEAESDRPETRFPKRVLVRKLDLRALDQPQGPETGFNAIIGKWPGDESDEEILALLEEMS
jgi:hypothetical protein